MPGDARVSRIDAGMPAIGGSLPLAVRPVGWQAAVLRGFPRPTFQPVTRKSTAASNRAGARTWTRRYAVRSGGRSSFVRHLLFFGGRVVAHECPHPLHSGHRVVGCTAGCTHPMDEGRIVHRLKPEPAPGHAGSLQVGFHGCREFLSCLHAVHHSWGIPAWQVVWQRYNVTLMSYQQAGCDQRFTVDALE